VAALCVAAAALSALPARAQDAGSNDPSGCLRASPVGVGDGLAVLVARDARGYSVRVVTADGRERALRAATCAQARNAARVVVALARADEVDAQALPAGPPPPVPEVATTVRMPARTPRREAALPPAVARRRSEPRERTDLRWHVTASGGLAVGPGVAPEAALGAGLTAGAVRLDLAAVMRAPDAQAVRGAVDATTEVRAWLGRARVCGVLGAGARASLGVCASLELGALEATASGAGVTSQGPRTTVWAASTGGVTASVALAPSLAVVGELDVGVAWSRPQLAVEGAGAARATPGYVVGARAGLELRL